VARGHDQARYLVDDSPVSAPELLERLDPAGVSPLVAYLASQRCDATGEIFSVAGGRYARVAILEGAGVRFDAVPDADAVADRFAQIRAMDATSEPRSLQDQVRAIAGELDSDGV
jgi:hypothetical protein